MTRPVSPRRPDCPDEILVSFNDQFAIYHEAGMGYRVMRRSDDHVSPLLFGWTLVQAQGYASVWSTQPRLMQDRASYFTTRNTMTWEAV